VNTNFQFANPWLLGLLLLVAVLAARHLLRVALRPLMTAVRLLAIAMLVIALARPQIVQGKETIKGEGVDIALALDISGSMASLDFQPANRLEAAKEVIGSFVEKRAYDKIGLVVFASAATHWSGRWGRSNWRPIWGSTTARPSVSALPTRPTCCRKATPKARSSFC